VTIVAADAAHTRPLVSIHNVSKQFANGTLAIRGVDLDLRDGEFVSLLGPSGCGKSTLLRIIAGLGAPSAGTVEWPTAPHSASGRPEPDLGFVFQDQDVVLVDLQEGEHRGRGEASGVYYLGDTAEKIVAAIETHRGEIEAGMGRGPLQQLLPPGGARNALDCALWELDASRAGQPVWKLAGLQPLIPLVTTFTLGADDPAVMAEGARKYSQAKSLKLKLTGDVALDIARVRAVRAVRPGVWMGVDANQGGEFSRSKVCNGEEMARCEGGGR